MVLLLAQMGVVARTLKGQPVMPKARLVAAAASTDTAVPKKGTACQQTVARTVAPSQHLRLQHQQLSRPPRRLGTMGDVVKSLEVLSVTPKARMEDAVQNSAIVASPKATVFRPTGVKMAALVNQLRLHLRLPARLPRLRAESRFLESQHPTQWPNRQASQPRMVLAVKSSKTPFVATGLKDPAVPCMDTVVTPLLTVEKVVKADLALTAPWYPHPDPVQPQLLLNPAPSLWAVDQVFPLCMQG
jgi:hypothetical protein